MLVDLRSCFGRRMQLLQVYRSGSTRSVFIDTFERLSEFTNISCLFWPCIAIKLSTINETWNKPASFSRRNLHNPNYKVIKFTDYQRSTPTHRQRRNSYLAVCSVVRLAMTSAHRRRKNTQHDDNATVSLATENSPEEEGHNKLICLVSFHCIHSM